VDVFEMSRLKSGQWFIVLNFVNAEQAEIARTTYSTCTLPSGNRIKCMSTRVPKHFLKDMPWAFSRSEGFVVHPHSFGRDTNGVFTRRESHSERGLVTGKNLEHVSHHPFTVATLQYSEVDIANPNDSCKRMCFTSGCWARTIEVSGFLGMIHDSTADLSVTNGCNRHKY